MFDTMTFVWRYLVLKNGFDNEIIMNIQCLRVPSIRSNSHIYDLRAYVRQYSRDPHAKGRGNDRVNILTISCPHAVVIGIRAM